MNFQKDNITSVKCNQQPGGKSTFSLAWDEGPKKEEEAKKPQQTTQQAANQAQGQQYQNQGIAAGKQVTKNQGNQSSIVFGDDNTNYYQKNAQGQYAQNTKPLQQNQYQQQQQIPQQQQHQQQNDILQQPQQQQNVKTSVKVHNPPGGKSNFTLG